MLLCNSVCKRGGVFVCVCVVGGQDQLIESDKTFLTCRQAARQTSVTLTGDEQERVEERKHHWEEVPHFPLPCNYDDDTSSQVHISSKSNTHASFCSTWANLQPLHLRFLLCPFSHSHQHYYPTSRFSMSG